MSNERKSKFLEPLKSFADFQGLRKMQQAVNALLNGKIAGTTGEVIYSDSNTIWNIGAPSSATTNAIIPFTIYNIPAASIIIEDGGSGYTAGDILEVSGGTGTPMTILVASVTDSGMIYQAVVDNLGSYSVQPTYPNFPIGGSGSGFSFSLGTSADNWRSFQVRDGYIGARSLYWLNDDNYIGDPNPFITWNYIPRFPLNFLNFSNGETEMLAYLDGQGVGINGSPNQAPYSSGSAIKLLANVDQLISGVDSVTGEYVRYEQIIMCDFDIGPSQDPSDAKVSFWIEIIDDETSGFGINVWARMCGYDTSGGSAPVMNSQPFPVGPNIIPIGVASSNFNYDFDTGVITPLNEFQYYQVLAGGLSGRYPITGGSVFAALPNAIGKQMSYRGKWLADVLEGQVFYPGDVVVDDSDSDINNLDITDGSGQISSYGVYVCKGDYDWPSVTNANAKPFFGDASPLNDTYRWEKFSSLIIDPTV
jgi:hypothetical protein